MSMSSIVSGILSPTISVVFGVYYILFFPMALSMSSIVSGIWSPTISIVFDLCLFVFILNKKVLDVGILPIICSCLPLFSRYLFVFVLF